MTPPGRHPFGLLDWTVLAAYAAVLLGIGLRLSRNQRTTEEYFVGGRRTRPFLAGISLLAAFLSVISYLGCAGEYVQYGPTLAVGVSIMALPFLQLAVGRILIPVFMRLPITSAYELLEVRLGRGVRRLGSVIYILTRLVWMALILYTGSSVLVNVIGCGTRWINAITIATGIVTTTYTLLGGIRSVMITEVVQFFVLLVGALLTIGSISIRLGGVSPWWPTHWERHWLPQPFFSLDPHVRVSVLGAFISQVIVVFCAVGSDQSSVQRFLSTRDAAAARRAYLFRNSAGALVFAVLALVGAALLGFYRLHPEAMPKGATFAGNGDAFFPDYISHYLPTGLAGLVVAGIMAAGMSGLSAGINSVITVISRDFVEVLRPDRTEAAQLRAARFLAIGVGGLVILGSVCVGMVRGDLFEVAGKTVNLLVCPLFGLFFLAIFVKYSTPFGAVFGAIFSATAAAEIAYWDMLTGLPKLSFLWIGPVAFVVSLTAGCLFSLLPTRGRPSLVIGAWSATALAVLFALVWWPLRHFG